MSMDGNMIRVVRAEGVMLIGSLEAGILKSPRAIMMRQDGAMMIVPMVGSPKEAQIPNSAITWEPTDEDLINAYRENVSGLVMAKAMPQNVVEIGGKR